MCILRRIPREEQKDPHGKIERHRTFTALPLRGNGEGRVISACDFGLGVQRG